MSQVYQHQNRTGASTAPSARLHVALVTPAYSPSHSGLAVLAKELAGGLVEAGCCVSLVIPHDSDPDDDQNGSISFYRFAGARKERGLSSPIEQLRKAASVRRILIEIHRAKPLDIVEFSNWQSLGVLANLGPEVTQITRLSSGALDIGPSLQSRGLSHLKRVALLRLNHTLETLAIRQSHFIITHSRTHWNHARDVYRLTHRWNQVHCIVAPGLSPPTTEKVYRERLEVFTILFIGKLNYRKGIDRVIQLAEGLVAFPDIRFEIRIIGDDSDPKNWPSLYASLTPRAKTLVSYLGAVPPSIKDQELRSCSVVFVPSRYESFGFVAVEGMLREKPIVAYRAGGLTEIVTDGENGFIVPQHSSLDRLKSIMVRLARDPVLCSDLGARGKSRAEQLFTRSRFAEKTVQCYHKALAIIR